jgi:hypothetical protein
MAYFLSLSTSDSGPTVNMTGKARESFSWVIAWIVNDMSKGVLRLMQAVRRIVHIDPHDLELAWTEMRRNLLKGELEALLTDLDVILNSRPGNGEPGICLQSVLSH